jgi:hypothetical protein
MNVFASFGFYQSDNVLVMIAPVSIDPLQKEKEKDQPGTNPAM